MVYRKKAGKRRKPRKTRRYPRYSNVSTKTPFPRTFKTNFKMVDQFSLIPAIPNYLDYSIYRATSLYQPQIGVSHQPRYFDQVMPMYDHYVVLGAKITIEALNASSTIPAILCVSLFDDGSALTSINDYMENKHARWKTVPTSDAGKSTFLSCTYSPKFLGKNNPINDDELKGTATTNPGENAYFHIVTAPMDGTSVGGTLNLIVTTQLHVAFIEPKDVAASTI